MASKLEEIEATFRKQRIRVGEWMAGIAETTSGSLSINGVADDDELSPGLRYRFYGKFTEYKGERQFKFQTFVAAQSHDREGVIEYLVQAGKGHQLGRVTARKLWDAFGSDAVRTVRETPGELIRFNSRITHEQAKEIGEILNSKKAVEDASIELTNLLAGRGLPKTTPRNAIKKWGNKAAQIIRRDPYSLMNFRGCGFKLCDSLFLELGHRPDRLKRQALCAWYSIASNNDGHTWFPINHVVQAIGQHIGSTKARPASAIKLAMRLGKLAPDHYGALAGLKTVGMNGPIASEGKCGWLAEGKRASAEDSLAESIASALTESEPAFLWPNPATIQGIDEHQREKLTDALTTMVAILGGSPGTGKTYATAMLIRALLQSGMVGPKDIAIGAPTGKAAVRLTEALQAAGVNLRARTWHSLLGVGMSDNDSGGWSFLHNEHNPWKFRIIIGDESSMLDTALMRSVMAARPRGCHVLWIGDINQLPPVGAGAPLRDLIASGTCGYGELTEIKRNSGGIVEACAAIRDGKRWHGGANLIIDEAGTPAEQMARILYHIAEAKRNGFDPVWDCQVLVAVNARSPLARKRVNEFLQAELNESPEIKGCPFRLNDKIVCTKNGKYKAIEAEEESNPDGETDEVYVANGELGRVLEIGDSYIVAELSSPKRVVKIPRGKSTKSEGDDSEETTSTGCAWDLAYGLSCHKSQGSEFPICITLIDEYPGARMVCSREWIFTALSRAKVKGIVLGKKATADAMCKRIAIGKRKTLLRERLQLAVATRAMEGMFV
jgi:exodeoxyribonuclease V alpha subunit